MESNKNKLTFSDIELSRQLFGEHNRNLQQIANATDVAIHTRGNTVFIEGDPVDAELAGNILEQLYDLMRNGYPIYPNDIDYAVNVLSRDDHAKLKDIFMDTVYITSKKRSITPKSRGQKEYIDAMRKFDIVFGVGPAGTGKTYLAMAMAVAALSKGIVNRIILTRPAVDAGESLGFLPGDITEKVDPYLRPLYDALHDMMRFEKASGLMQQGIIEVAPIAFMRGRAMPLYSRIITPTGWRTMGSLDVGDDVTGSDGQPVKVTGVFPQGKKMVYRVTMTDGSSAIACAEHLWAVRTASDKRRNKPARVLETQEIMRDLKSFDQYRYELPLLSAPVNWQHHETPVDPYSLGLLLGDGCITGKTSPGFSTSDAELVSFLEFGLADMDLLFQQKSELDYTITNSAGRGGISFNPLTQALRELNLSGTYSYTKFIPEIYLYNSPEVRLAVLQGLLDTDGGPVTQSGRTCRIQYSTTSEQLKDDVIFLVRSLGGVATWRRRKAEEQKPGFARGREIIFRNDAFVMNIRLPKDLEPFRLKRKADIYNKYGRGRPMRFIKRIEPVGMEETQCISVAASDSLYVTDDFILTHNTLNDSFIILDEAQNTTSEQMKMFLTRIGFNSKAVITGDITQIDLPGNRQSGLVEAKEILQDIDGIQFVFFSKADVVRHRLVQEIIRAYEDLDAMKRK